MNITLTYEEALTMLANYLRSQVDVSLTPDDIKIDFPNADEEEIKILEETLAHEYGTCVGCGLYASNANLWRWNGHPYCGSCLARERGSKPSKQPAPVSPST